MTLPVPFRRPFVKVPLPLCPTFLLLMDSPPRTRTTVETTLTAQFATSKLIDQLFLHMRGKLTFFNFVISDLIGDLSVKCSMGKVVDTGSCFWSWLYIDVSNKRVSFIYLGRDRETESFLQHLSQLKPKSREKFCTNNVICGWFWGLTFRMRPQRRLTYVSMHLST
jgi:hypothetical protein